MSNTSRGIIDCMIGRRAPEFPIFGAVAYRVVPASAGPSGPSHSNGRPLVEVAHYRTVAAPPSNTKGG
jgi:hypothetical protein